MSVLRSARPLQGATLLAVTISVMSGRPYSVIADDCVMSDLGEKLALDARQFELKRERTEDHPGYLTYGGYCQLGAQQTKYTYWVADKHVKDAFVEVVKHPPEYEHVRHDLIGALQVASGQRDIPLRTSRETCEKGSVQYVNWTCHSRLSAQTICFAGSPSAPKGGLVAWYSRGVSTNGLITVCIGYAELEGLPKQLIDEFLAKYPSAVDKQSFLPDDWVDEDLKKWIQILRDMPDNKITLQVAARHLWQYEREAQEAWGAMKIFSKPIGSDELRDSIRSLTKEVERWRLQRKR